jgi:hypothetical protein
MIGEAAGKLQDQLAPAIGLGKVDRNGVRPVLLVALRDHISFTDSRRTTDRE